MFNLMAWLSDACTTIKGDPRCHGTSISPLRIGHQSLPARVRRNKLFAVPQAQDEEL
jgi:hypothetical protein